MPDNKSTNTKSSASRTEKSRKKVDKKKNENELKVIRLLGNRSVYHVNIDDFAKVSNVVKQQQNTGSVMTSVDLHRFSDQSILAFVHFIQNREIKTSLTYYAIAEIITLANTFHMLSFKREIESSLLNASKTSTPDLLQTLIIANVAHVTFETERLLHQAANEKIENIVQLPDFQKIPYIQLYHVLSSCELAVSHEMFVADVVLLWLTGQSNPANHIPGLFSCIRSKYLSPIDKTLILERISMLNMSGKVVRLVRNILDSPLSQRVCMDPTHLKRNLPRCGMISSLPSSSPYSSLPLSKPIIPIKIRGTTRKTVQKKKKTFDPNSAPKVMELIEMSSKCDQSQKIKQMREMKKKVKRDRRKLKKRSCACVEYLKSRCRRKRTSDMEKGKYISVKPPGASTKSTSVSLKSKSKSDKSPQQKQTELRRDKKRNSINKAIVSVRKSNSQSSKSSTSMSSRKSEKMKKSSKNPDRSNSQKKNKRKISKDSSKEDDR